MPRPDVPPVELPAPAGSLVLTPLESAPRPKLRMMRPTPLSWPSGEDIDALLRKISAEIERLQQENFALVREVNELRADHSAFHKGSSFLLRSSSAIKSGSVFSADVSSSLAQALQAKAVPTSPHGSERKETSNRSSNETGTGLHTLFRQLDARGAGMVTVADLTALLHNNGEDFDPDCLEATCRLLNAAGQCHHGAEEALAGCASNADPGVAACLKSLQKAVQQQFLDRISSHSRSYEVRGGNIVLHSMEKEKPLPLWLEAIPMSVIILNMLVIGLSADFPELNMIWDACEAGFVCFYLLEFAIKLWMFGGFGYFGGAQRWWNRFDFGCLLLSLLDLSLGAYFYLQSHNRKSMGGMNGWWLIKVFRIARIARLVRTLRFKIFHEFKLIVLGVVSGLRVLSWAIVLLVFLTYLVGVALTFILKEQGELEFASVLSSMFTLFRCWTDGCVAYDGTPLPERLRREYGPVVIVVHILMMMFVTVGVFNLVMAIFIDNVVTSQMVRKTREMQNRSQIIEKKLKRLVIKYIRDGVKERTEKQSLLQRMESAVSLVSERVQWMSWSEAGGTFSGSSPGSRRSSCDSEVEVEWDSLRQMEVGISRDLFLVWLDDEDFQQLLDEAEIEMTNQIELFDILDTNMDGQLSMDELTTGLMKLRGPVTKADIVSVRLKVRHLAHLFEGQDWSPRHRKET